MYKNLTSFLLGILVTLLGVLVFGRPRKQTVIQREVQTVVKPETLRLHEVKVIKVKDSLQTESRKEQPIPQGNGDWKLYHYTNHIDLYVEADTVKSAIYKVKPEYKIIPVQSEPKPKKNFVMFTACNHSLFLNYSREYKYNLSSFWAFENFRPSLGNIQLTYSPVPWFSIGTGWDFWKNEPEIVAGINFSF